jgi:small subunit ribosomal protein S10
MFTIKIYLTSYNFKTLILFFSYIKERIKKLKNSVFYEVRGPIFLSYKNKKLTLLKSPHVNKKSRDQLEILTYNFFIEFKIKKKLGLSFISFLLNSNSILFDRQNGLSYKIIFIKKKKYYFIKDAGILNV